MQNETGVNKMQAVTVRFTYMWGDWKTYIANHRCQCKGNTDKSIYDEVIKNNCTIQMGKVCAEIVK